VSVTVERRIFKVMEKMCVEAEARASFGKGASRKLRARGLIPAIVYGEKGEPIPVALDPKDLIRILRSQAGANTIFDLEVKGSKGKENVMVKDYQLEPVEHELLHADLIRVAMDHALTVTVPIELVGTAVGVKQEGGIMDFVTRAIEVSCMPADIPERLKVDVSGLELGQLIRVSERELAERVTLESEPGLVVAHVLAPKVEVEEEEAPVEEAEGAEPEVIKKGKAEAAGEEPPPSSEDSSE
jgi:large subunit ribosomal protein L25